MPLSNETISKIIGESGRFCSPYDEPESYYIVGDTGEKDNMFIGLFYEKMTYAVSHADDLIAGAFDNDFYDFYGVNRDIIRSPEEMSSQLYFDSFVLDIKDNSIGACLSNDRFMFGHFIEIHWDNEWKITSRWIN